MSTITDNLIDTLTRAYLKIGASTEGGQEYFNYCQIANDAEDALRAEIRRIELGSQAGKE